MRSVRRAVATCLCAFARALAAFATRRAGGPWYCARLLAVERVRRRHPHLSRRGFSKPPPQPIAVLTRLSYNGFFSPDTAAIAMCLAAACASASSPARRLSPSASTALPRRFLHSLLSTPTRPSSPPPPPLLRRCFKFYQMAVRTLPTPLSGRPPPSTSVSSLSSLCCGIYSDYLARAPVKLLVDTLNWMAARVGLSRLSGIE